MKILVYGINYAPEFIGIAKYTTEMCQYFEKAGHKVRVVTAPPYYPSWKIQRPYHGYLFSSEDIDQVHVSRCPLFVPRSPGALGRILHHLSFAAFSGPTLISAALRFRPHVLLAIAPSLLGLPGAITAARLSGAAAWVHIQDFEVDSAFDFGFVSNSKFRKLALWVERLLLRRFDRVSSISANMARSLERKGVPTSRILEFRNWVDTNFIVPSQTTALRRSLKLPESAKIAMYSGNMGAKQGIDYLAGAAQRLAETRPDIAFVLCGSGPMKERLLEMTQSLPLVRHLDLQPVEKLPELLSTADIHLLPQRPETMDLALPSKLAGMLASGRPVVAMANPGTQLWAELDGIGIVVPPADIDALCGAIVRLADDGDLRNQLGVKGRELARSRWDRRCILPQIDLELQGLGKSLARFR
jgi:colanic acid biosynthesis glycosyl transferase WcaI